MGEAGMDGVDDDGMIVFFFLSEHDDADDDWCGSLCSWMDGWMVMGWTGLPDRLQSLLLRGLELRPVPPRGHGPPPRRRCRGCLGEDRAPPQGRVDFLLLLLLLSFFPCSSLDEFMDAWIWDGIDWMDGWDGTGGANRCGSGSPACPVPDRAQPGRDDLPPSRESDLRSLGDHESVRGCSEALESDHAGPFVVSFFF